MIFNPSEEAWILNLCERLFIAFSLFLINSVLYIEQNSENLPSIDFIDQLLLYIANVEIFAGESFVWDFSKFVRRVGRVTEEKRADSSFDWLVTDQFKASFLNINQFKQVLILHHTSLLFAVLNVHKSLIDLKVILKSSYFSWKLDQALYVLKILSISIFIRGMINALNLATLVVEFKVFEVVLSIIKTFEKAASCLHLFDPLVLFYIYYVVIDQRLGIILLLLYH